MNYRQNEKEAIAMIQKYLRQLSYHDPQIPNVAIDGIWENNTSHAVRNFQRKYELPQTGTVDFNTWELLKQKYDESIDKHSPIVRIEFFPVNPENYSFGIGNEGWQIGVLQHIIGELSKNYPFDAVEINEKYDLPTSNAIMDFQKIHGITPTGRVDRNTWNNLANSYNIMHYNTVE